MFPLTAKKKGFSVRLTAIAHGCVIPETELEVEVFEKTVMLHPEEPIPEALKNPNFVLLEEDRCIPTIRK